MFILTLKMSLLVMMVIPILTFADSEMSYKNHCTHTRSRDLIKVMCSNYKTIPQNLRTDLQVLDIRGNHIGRLFNNSLTRYPNLQEAYFHNNGMTEIEESALEPIQCLRILDLSDNLLFKLPSNIFTLPELRKLYLDSNNLTDKVFESIKVTSPIVNLDLRNNNLMKISTLKSFMEVETLNLTANKITQLSADSLAHLCSLRELNVKDNPIVFNRNDCECIELDRWIDIRNIKLDIPLNCSKNPTCPVQPSNSTLTIYKNCQIHLKEHVKVRQSRTIKIWIGIIVGIVLTAGCVYGVFVYRRRRNSRTSKSRSTQTISPPIITSLS